MPSIGKYAPPLTLQASVLCATDTVAALAIVREAEFPTLNSILFGEGVVNDAVSILLFQAVETTIEDSSTGDPDDFEITGEQIGLTIWRFLYLSFLSIILAFWLFCSFLLK